METGHAPKAAQWRKSSYSGNTGGDCVECAVAGSAAWRKSSHSGNTGGDCVEVHDGCAASVPVRDSKVQDGPVVVIGADAWRTFVAGL
ncbi:MULTISPECIES: DUF397 domain-containing protein [unclassified Streptomyces]|uniref:DUF397 domain-containing protein n=1 Tax=unclassified Streptomyces TaxID=2593676 RepID=UPI000DACBAF2|nr:MULTISPECIES: DUF397 domain-containing protein [unclassified Streptomyces]PZT74930.1 DUF397 domain-containing protein [Streptomyces sp. AC1-42T]PZT82087.1 DUF397 domain-containing protein [Streptomyces sp. AC1-42W]